jgi:serine/threonine protein kinase
LCEILCQITECLKYLEERNCYHGDIKPANIFFDKNGVVKLVDSYFTHLGKSNFELVLSSPTNLSYLSPAQLTNLRKGNYSGSN